LRKLKAVFELAFARNCLSSLQAAGHPKFMKACSNGSKEVHPKLVLFSVNGVKLCLYIVYCKRVKTHTAEN
jgi:hypothetical protein